MHHWIIQVLRWRIIDNIVTIGAKNNLLLPGNRISGSAIKKMDPAQIFNGL
jgi:hypothetical protein